MTWYPATAANADSGDAVIKETQYENNAPVIPYKTRTSHCISKESVTSNLRAYIDLRKIRDQRTYFQPQLRK